MNESNAKGYDAPPAVPGFREGSGAGSVAAPAAAPPAALRSARSESARRRWWIFGTLTLIYILVCFYRVSMAMVAGDISRELHLTPAQLGTLSSILVYVYAFAQLPLGPMIDRLGSKTIICSCGVLAAVGGICFSQAHTLYFAMAARILIGIGTAAALMGSFAIFSRWFTHQEFGRVSGLMIAIGNLGNLSATAPLALCVAAVGWRSSFLVIGFAQLAITLLVFLVVRERPAGMAEERVEKDPRAPGMVEDWKEIFGSRDFWFLGGLVFFQYGNVLALQGLWGGPYLTEVLHLSTPQVGRFLLTASLGAVTGALVGDTVARKIVRSYKKTIIGGQSLFALLMAGFIGYVEYIPQPLLYLTLFITGVVGTTGVLAYPVVRTMFPVRVVGTALTSINFFVLFGGAVTQQVMGFIMNWVGGGRLSAPALHAAFLFPVIGLATVIAMYSFAKDYTNLPGK